MKKTVTLILIALLSVGMLFASPAQEVASEEVTLRVLNYIDLSEPNSANEIAMIWDKFQAENPGIKIEREDLFDEAFHQKTEAYAASGNLPDVMYMWPGGRSTTLQENRLVKDLTPFLIADGIYDDYTEAAVAPQTCGYLAELPNGITTTNLMYVNKTVLNDCGLSIPKTYAELKAMVPVLKAKGYGCVGMDNKSEWVMQSCLFSLVVGRFGGADWANELKAGTKQFTDAWFVNSLALIADMYESGVINRNTLEIDYGSGRGEFANNRCAFYIDGDWSTAAFQEDLTTGNALLSRERQANDIELMAFPAIEGEVVSNTNSGVVGTGWGMNAEIPAGSAKEAAAWKLIKFLEGEYAQTYRLTTGASFPSLKTIDVAKVLVDNNLEPLVGKRAEYYTKYTLTPVIDGVLHSDVYNVINRVLAEIGLGSTTVDKGVQEIQKAWVAYQAK
ncbi:MAG: ABC transporter substrate-binding protein [Sphaerochaetaceae bacterium]|jgi:raffinose/stachyose/melibiose transport system substrate-binding protein|nr:ABC transporter substrate-binding protein [Sphaerochaetaceae bacterium]